MWWNKNKKIKFFALTCKEAPDKFLTLTASKNDAIEYGMHLIRLNHLEHFRLWCKQRDLSDKSASAWDLYYQDCIDVEEKANYVVMEVAYKKDLVAAMLRCFGNCIPLGCSFELDLEYTYMLDKLKSFTADDEDKNLDEDSEEGPLWQA